MRVLIAGRNAQGLAQAAGAIPHDLTIETATTKAAAIALLERAEFDLVIACEKLGDGLGLEVLSHVAVNTPNTLRVFAARPSTLQALKNELGFFGLFRTFPYPINFRKLWSTLNLAGSCCTEPEAVQVRSPPKPRVSRIRHVVLDSSWEVPGVEVLPRSPASAGVAAVAGAHAPAGARAKAGDLAVISSSETVRVTAVRPRSNGGAAGVPGHGSSPGSTTSVPSVDGHPGGARRVPQSQSAPVTTAARVMTDRPPPAVSGGAVANGRPVAHNRPAVNGGRAVANGRPPAAAARPTNAIQASPPARRVQASPVPSGVARPPSRIPESEAFKRARARRNEAREQEPLLATNGARRRRESSVANGAKGRREPSLANGAQRRREPSVANGQKGRREPSLANDSLAQLARLATTRRPTYDPRSSMPGSRRRKALFVGSGVFAGGAAALLTFFMIGTNSSIGQSSVPVATSVAAIDHPVPQNVLPWQAPSAPQSTSTSFARNQTARNQSVTPAIDADMEVEAEAASEPVGIEPGHPGPPPPNPPPPPAEPPTLYDASGMPIDE
jgi:hypothetical protein